jgi:dihydroflavonol-4-reductase
MRSGSQVTAGKRSLLTGATGFVGAAVLRRLLAAGHCVRALVRKASRRDNLAGLEVECVEGDLRDAQSVERAMAGIDTVFHVAADYRLWARDPEEIRRSNLEGTRHVMAAALRAGVGRVVYTSSVATLAPRADGSPADETDSIAESAAVGAYKQSKVAAEALVRRMVAEEGLPAVIVNPSTPIGPSDIKPTPTGRIIVEAASGRMPGYVDTALNLVHVDDVAAGHLAAFERGRVGESYILGGDNVALARMLAEIARISGRRPPSLRIPRRAVYPIAFFAEAAARITGREPFVTLDGLRMAKYRMVFSSAKAERELGYKSRPHGEALGEAVAWFRQQGYVP